MVFKTDHGIEHQIVVTIIKSQRGEVMVPCDHWGMSLPYGPMLGDQSIIQHAPISRISDPAAWCGLSTTLCLRACDSTTHRRCTIITFLHHSITTFARQFAMSRPQRLSCVGLLHCRHVNASSGPPATSTQSHHTSFVELRNGSFAAIGAAGSHYVMCLLRLPLAT